MNAISSYRGNRPTNTATNPHTDRTDYNTLCRSYSASVARVWRYRNLTITWLLHYISAQSNYNVTSTWCLAENTWTRSRLPRYAALSGDEVPEAVWRINHGHTGIQSGDLLLISLTLQQLNGSMKEMNISIYFFFSTHHSMVFYFRCSVYWWKGSVRF